MVDDRATGEELPWLLAERQSRRIYRHLATATGALSRDEVAEAMQLPKATAAYHLERLTRAGLLAAASERRTGRSGPGAGRPARVYRAVVPEVAASVPARRYDVSSEVLAAAVEASDADGRPVREALLEVASGTGRRLVAECGSLERFLDETGYEPAPDGAGGTVLTNCPFHRLATRYTDLICSANAALLAEAAEAGGLERDAVRLDPAEGRCCVRIAAEVPSTG